jgi:hypothetical protein
MVLGLLLMIISHCYSEGHGEGNSGVLVGFRNDAEDISTYRTLWITNESGKVNISQSAGIFVPYDNSFWEINSKWYEKETYSYLGKTQIHMEYLLAQPLGETISTEDKLRNYLHAMLDDWDKISESSKLIFAGNRYACIRQDNDYDSGGPLKPGKSNIFVREFKDINRSFVYRNHNDNFDSRKDVSIERFFDSSVLSYIKEYYMMKLTEAEQDLYGSYPTVHNQTDEFGWGLVRKAGHWQLQIAKKWLFEKGSASINTLEMCDLPLTVPKELVSDGEFNYNFRDLKKVVPSAVDAVASPTQDLWVVLTPGTLLIFTGKDLKDPLALNIHSKEYLIMAEWAVGKDVQKWNEELSGYLK